MPQGEWGRLGRTHTGQAQLDRLDDPRPMDFRAGELVALRAGSPWPELVGPIPMIHAKGHPVWLAAPDVDTGDGLGVPTTLGSGKLDSSDPVPKDWVELEGQPESGGFNDWPGLGIV